MYEKFKKITTIVSDVDGVLTNNSLVIAHDDTLWRVMNSRDGLAFVLAMNANYKVMIITGGRNEKVAKRLEGLGISEIHLGCYQKGKKIEELKEKYNLKKEEIAYIGDDLNDLAVFDKVGLAVCPKDAVPEIKAKANYVSNKKGGEGCVRDLIEKIMRLNDCWGYPKSV